MVDYAYDIETYCNFFSVVIGHIEKRLCWKFEISDRKDEREELIQFLREVKHEGSRLVGFNNVGFDAQVLQFILKNQNCSVKQIYNCAQKIINANDEDRFKLLTPEYKLLLPQIDLYLLHHFNNKARATSLKALEFNMRSDNIEDLPYSPDTKLTDTQKDKVLAYNKHDMVQTVKFYNENLDQIRFREELSKKYGRNFLNYNDTKIGKAYFVMRLEEANPGCCYKDRKIQQTKRDEIHLEDCILPYIEFERPEFRAVKDWLAKQTITKTKGVFTDILEKDLGELAQYATMRTKQRKYPSHEEAQEASFEGAWVEDRELKSKKISNYLCWNVADNLNTVVDGFQFDFGTGGLHGAVENTIVESTERRVIRTFDVASYYPNLAIVNKLYPEHLGDTFYEVYSDVYNQRKQYEKGTPENAMMKLALNGVYGASNSVYSPFYDPLFTMTITVSGQLTLCMLAESLMEIPTLEMIMVNTDGLEFMVDKEYDCEAEKVCMQWENKTGLTLEGGYYSKMAIANCNNYLAVEK